MEGELLASIGSHLHPPTAGSFCLIFLSGFSSFPTSMASAIDTCHFMIELAACGERERERERERAPFRRRVDDACILPSQVNLDYVFVAPGRLLLRASQAIEVGGGRRRGDDGTGARVLRNDPSGSFQFRVHPRPREGPRYDGLRDAIAKVIRPQQEADRRDRRRDSRRCGDDCRHRSSRSPSSASRGYAVAYAGWRCARAWRWHRR
jgi:hypothetical protein